MKRTDYGRVSERYDDNELRKRIPADEVVADMLRVREGSLSALDLACGTGNYLAVQQRAFGDRVTWRALDASDAMLAKARAKVEGVDFVHGTAEELPYESHAFDYVVSSYAFHHFENKRRALDEVRRVTRKNGVVRFNNIDPKRMTGWWVYTLFPSAALEDEKRFWSAELLAYELEQRGFDAHTRIEVILGTSPLTEVVGDVERRDISQLAILDDAVYARGLERARQMLASEPNGRIRTEIALIVTTATSRDA